MSIIEVNNLEYNYDTQDVLKKISVSFEKGKLYSIIGPNGSGKTTLLSLIAKHLSSDTGKIIVNSLDIKSIKYKELAKQMAVVKQKNEIGYDFSVYDIVMMGRSPYKKRFENNNKEDIRIVDEALELTNSIELKDKSITELSGGELQRVILARAVAQNTDILLLDEPISFLDIQHQIKFMSLIKNLCTNKGITVINVIHDLNLALYYSDNIIMLREGQVYKSGNAESVLTRDSISEVYGISVEIIKHPKDDNKKVIIY